MLIYDFHNYYISMQLIQGSQANIIVPNLPTLADCTPRAWNLSQDGTLVAVGFKDGALQVMYMHVFYHGHIIY